jgi:hypothetical protein
LSETSKQIGAAPRATAFRCTGAKRLGNKEEFPFFEKKQRKTLVLLPDAPDPSRTYVNQTRVFWLLFSKRTASAALAFRWR